MIILFNAQQSFDVFTDMGYYFPWVNATIIDNGGMQACDFSISAPPTPGECEALQKINLTQGSPSCRHLHKAFSYLEGSHLISN